MSPARVLFWTLMLDALKKMMAQRNPLRLLWHRGKAFVAAVRFGFPATRLTVIGITGTDGKTTSVGMTAHILNVHGIKAGALSTAFFQVGTNVTFNATQKTSPSPFTVQRFLRRCLRAGCTHVVLEVSSHGLDQGRLDWTYPSIAAITNLAEEHLDYHGTMEDYLRTKGKLFHKVGMRGTKILHTSDRSTAYLRTIPTQGTMHYNQYATVDSLEPQITGPVEDFWASDVLLRSDGCDATVHFQSQDPHMQFERQLRLRIPGGFNVENALCAIACCKALPEQVAFQGAVDALATFAGVPGRMERIDAGQPFTVIVDFTVTPQSYERTLSTIKQGLAPGQRLLVLTGSCGDRMKEKRPIVGRICSEHADVVVVSNEDPYTEDPLHIIEEVWMGIDQSRTRAHKLFDRKEAIAFLLAEARPGDAVVLCGKGSDTTMWVKDGQVPWNEREIVRAMLAEKWSTRQ